MVHLDLVETVRAELARHADPERAAGQQRYMKSAIPYRGLTSPQLTTVLAPHPRRPRLPAWPVREQWEATIRALWDGVAYREEWYAAIALARYRAYRRWLDSESMPLWRRLVVTGAWWDVVDEVATHLVRDTWGRTGRRGTAAARVGGRRDAVAAADGDHQPGRAQGPARPDLLTDAIEPNIADRDFFIRKAIGWALRDHARATPDWVRAFVDAHAGELSGLSRREATRHLTPGATPAASPRPRGG